MTFFYFLCNALWLGVTFTLQLMSTTVFIQLPKIDMNLQFTGEYMNIDPVSFMFILSFALVVALQFLAMLYYR